MSVNWYPIINYENCTECGSCFDKCTHGVYEQEGNRTIVVQPVNCIENCRGCQELCPSEAIEYAGDNGKGDKNVCNCDCGGKC